MIYVLQQFCQVMLDAQGANKGSGFVAFSNPEEATRAVSCSLLATSALLCFDLIVCLVHGWNVD